MDRERRALRPCSAAAPQVTGPHDATSGLWESRATVRAVSYRPSDATVAGAGAPAGAVVMRSVIDGPARGMLLLLVAVNVAAQVTYLTWLLAPGHWSVGASEPAHAAALSIVAFAALGTVEVLRAVQCSCLWTFSLCARDPIPTAPPAGLRVAVLTTIVPSHEPVETVALTLAAMRRIRYADGTVDVWILDEADDARVREAAASLGVHHFTRHGRPSYNTPSGPFRARTKAGNHNAWLAEHGRAYDVVAQLDPDHVPYPHFLERTLGYFRDPDVGFVVAPQVYGDAGSGFVPHGAAAQAYVFHGVIQRGGNGLGAPLLIGTNHVYRVSTWRQIGGYQDSIIEDHLTSMTVHATVNPLTGRRWRGVYTPDVLAVGRAPATWGSFFSQQRRWAYGAAEIAFRHSPQLLRRLAWRQRLTYVLLQSFYPAVATTWVLGTGVTLAYLVGVAQPPALDPARWAALWSASVLTTLALFLWLRRVNIADHERREFGIPGAVATLCTAPVYAAAIVRAAVRWPLAYQVTPKGRAARPDGAGVFRRHMAWLVLVAAALAISVTVRGVGHVSQAWGLVWLAVLALPPAMHVVTRPRARRSAGAAPPASACHGRRRGTRPSRTPSRPRRPRRARLARGPAQEPPRSR